MPPLKAFGKSSRKKLRATRSSLEKARMSRLTRLLNFNTLVESSRSVEQNKFNTSTISKTSHIDDEGESDAMEHQEAAHYEIISKKRNPDNAACQASTSDVQEMKAKRLLQQSANNVESASHGPSTDPTTSQDSDRAPLERQQSEIFFESHVENESFSTHAVSQLLHEDEVLMPIKTEAPDEYTVVIQDPISMQTIEGTYKELFPANACQKNEAIGGVEAMGDVQAISVYPIADVQAISVYPIGGVEAIGGVDDDPEDGKLIIDAPPPRKRQKKVFDLQYYKSELFKCKQELKQTRQELKECKQKLNHNELQLTKKDREILRKLTKNNELQQELRKYKRDNSILEKKIISLENELLVYTRQIKPVID